MKTFEELTEQYVSDDGLNYEGLRAEALEALDGRPALEGIPGITTTVNALVAHVENMFATLWRAHVDVAQRAGAEIDVDEALQAAAVATELSFLRSLYDEVRAGLEDGVTEDEGTA